LEAVVVGVPDEKQGEAIVAVIRVKDSMKFNELLDSIKEHLKDRLTYYKIPKQFVSVDKIPRNNLGKVTISSILSFIFFSKIIHHHKFVRSTKKLFGKTWIKIILHLISIISI